MLKYWNLVDDVNKDFLFSKWRIFCNR